MTALEQRLLSRTRALWRAIHAAAGVAGREELNEAAYPQLSDDELAAMGFDPHWTPADVMTPARCLRARMERRNHSPD